MGFNYDMGGEKNEALFQQERANKLTDVTIGLTGSTIPLAGTGVQTAGPLSGSRLYVVVSKVAFHALASSDPLASASVGDQYWPADAPIYHIAVSGSSEYISVINNDGTAVECWITLAEREEGDL